MKRAKIMLTAIAVFAVVGGALAFRAQKFVYVQSGGAGLCNVKITGVTTTNVSPNPAIPLRLATPGACTTTTFTTTVID
jgi:hypothetical protein